MLYRVNLVYFVSYPFYHESTPSFPQSTSYFVRYFAQSSTISTVLALARHLDCGEFYFEESRSGYKKRIRCGTEYYKVSLAYCSDDTTLGDAEMELLQLSDFNARQHGLHIALRSTTNILQTLLSTGYALVTDANFVQVLAQLKVFKTKGQHVYCK